MPIVLDKSYKASNYKRKCLPKITCIELRKKYGSQLYPVCPMLKKVMNKKVLYDFPDISIVDPVLKSVIKILLACEVLTNLKPDIQTVVFCAHREHFLKDWIDPIKEDLSALSQRLEKDFPNTSKNCIELVAGLQVAEFKYTMNGGSRIYLWPPDPEYGNWATFLEWRKRTVDLADQKGFSESIEMNRLTSAYPAEAIRAAIKIHKELLPLAQTVLPEQTELVSRTDLPNTMMGDKKEKETKPARHSPDFRSVCWFGNEYNFTPIQAAAVEILWEAWENGTPDVGGDTLAIKIDSESKRARDIFKNTSAWNTMIISGKTKGSYRLVEPEK